MIEVKTFGISEKYSKNISSTTSSQSGGFAMCPLPVGIQGLLLLVLFAVSGKLTSALKETEKSHAWVLAELVIFHSQGRFCPGVLPACHSKSTGSLGFAGGSLHSLLWASASMALGYGIGKGVQGYFVFPSSHSPPAVPLQRKGIRMQAWSWALLICRRNRILSRQRIPLSQWGQRTLLTEGTHCPR